MDFILTGSIFPFKKKNNKQAFNYILKNYLKDSYAIIETFALRKAQLVILNNTAMMTKTNTPTTTIKQKQ